MALVQRIDFMLGLNQIIRLIQTPQANAIKLSLGVEEDGRIVMKAYGVIWTDNGAQTSSNEEGEYACPVPPDCENNPICIANVLSLIDVNVTSGTAFNLK